jgi:hypothetical protein
MALCQDVDGVREFWCEQADIKAESIDQGMCADEIALCYVLEHYLCSAQKVNF